MHRTSTLEKLFPPPQYMTLPAVGVDISDTSLKYVGFERVHAHDTNLSLASWGDISVPGGVVERGNVHDQGVLVSTLREVKEKTRASYVTLSLPEERAYLFETTLPEKTHRKQMRELLEFRLEENVPLSPRDAYFDFSIVGLDKSTGEYHLTVAVYARDIINHYYEACVDAELLPIAFEIEAQAIARATVPWGNDETYMIVDFGKTRTGIGIVFHGSLAYTSTIDVSGGELSRAMRQILGDRPESELTEWKNTKGIVATADNAEIARVLQEVMKNMADELAVRMHYWHTRKNDRGERAIKKIVLCGGSANLWGLPEYLSDSLEVPTERAMVWQNAFALKEYVPPITRKYSYGYATAIGLALRGFVPHI